MAQDAASTAVWCATTRSRSRSSPSRSAAPTSRPRASDRSAGIARRTAATDGAPRASCTATVAALRARGIEVALAGSPRSAERSAGCLATTAESARSTVSVATPQASSWITRARFHQPGSGAPRPRNQRCGGDAGAGPRSSAAVADSAAVAESVPATSIIPLIVGCSTNCAGVTRTPARWARASTRILESESPPRAKKSSSTPTVASPSTSFQMSASATSTSVRGGLASPAATDALACSGGGTVAMSGRAPRSIFPDGVRGSASRTATREGRIAAVRRASQADRSSAGSS